MSVHPSRYQRRHLSLVGGPETRTRVSPPPVDTKASLSSSLSSATTNLHLAELRGDTSATQAWSLSKRFLEDALRCLNAERGT